MSRRTALDLVQVAYGSSREGCPLRWIPARGPCELLIVAGIHGEEPDTTVALSRAYRSIEPDRLSPLVGAVLCANPDGVIRGTRGNAAGVDLNRNFPTSNWQTEPTTCRWHVDEKEELPILTGAHAASEPETRHLIELIESASPRAILALHGPLACVDDPCRSSLGHWIAGKAGLPLVTDIGYPTPGSMGTWAEERRIPIVTWEFPPESIESLSKMQVPVLAAILQGRFPMTNQPGLQERRSSDNIGSKPE